MQRILLVDDEQNVLNALRRELAGLYEVEAFVSPQEALRRAAEMEFALVVSDYRMPDMDGVTFLEHLGQIQPDAVRLILSGQADADALIKAINVTHIYRFLTKPWDEAGLKPTIQQGLDYREAILENRRLAKFYRQLADTSPQEQERRLYRVAIVLPDENAAAAMSRELERHSASEWQYGAMRSRPSYGGHDFQLVINRFTSPLEALDYLKNNPCDLVITDVSMPEMNGVEFFNKLRQAGADSTCILVGECLDMSTLSDAINQAHIDSFLKYTWSGYELKFTVMRALRYRDLLLENQALANELRELVDKLGNPE